MASETPGPAQMQEKGSGRPSQDAEAAAQQESAGTTDDDNNDNTNANGAGVTQKSEKKSLGFHLSFIGIALVTFVFSLDATTLAVALPAITEQLAGTTLQSFWAGIAYLLCVVVTQPLYTGISDAFGRPPTLYFGFLLFALGSIIFAIAQNMTTVVIGRMLQGLGGGGMDLMAEVIVADMTTLQERSLYLGLLAIPTAIGSILGPTLGALLSTKLSWRWIGWINLPILGAAFILLVLFLRLRKIESSTVAKLKRLDWGGAVLSLVGTTMLVVPLSWANALYPWASWQTLLPLFIGVALIVTFVFYEFRIPRFPIFPLRLFSSISINLNLVGNFIYGASLYSLLQYIPLLYQAVKLQTAIQSAVSLLPTSVLSVVFAVLSVIIVGVIGKGYRWALRTCWVILTVGTGLLGLIGPEIPTSMLIGLPILWGAAIGALMRLLHLPMQAGVTNVDDTGLMIGLLLMVRQCGGVVGLALSSSIFNSVFASSVRNLELSGPLAVIEDASQAIGFIPHLKSSGASPEVLDPVLQTYAMAMRPIFYTMTGLSAVGLLTSIFTKDESLKRTDLGRQQFED